MGDWEEDSDSPAEGGDEGGPLDVGEGEDVERAADGEVSLQGEGEDGENRGVASPGRIMVEVFRIMNYVLTPLREMIVFYRKVLQMEKGIDASRQTTRWELLKGYFYHK